MQVDRCRLSQGGIYAEALNRRFPLIFQIVYISIFFSALCSLRRTRASIIAKSVRETPNGILDQPTRRNIGRGGGRL